MDNKAKKYISVDYALHSIDEQGTHLEEKTTADRPFIFLSGFGLALPAFEERIVPLSEGEDFDFNRRKEEDKDNPVLSGFDELENLSADYPSVFSGKAHE